MLEDCYKIQREKKKNALGPASVGKKGKLNKPKAGPTHRRCPEILSVMETYRNRIENVGNNEISEYLQESVKARPRSASVLKKPAGMR